MKLVQSLAGEEAVVFTEYEKDTLVRFLDIYYRHRDKRLEKLSSKPPGNESRDKIVDRLNKEIVVIGDLLELLDPL